MIHITDQSTYEAYYSKQSIPLTDRHTKGVNVQTDDADGSRQTATRATAQMTEQCAVVQLYNASSHEIQPHRTRI